MWQEAYLESRVLGADPVELVRILYQAALDAVHDARVHLGSGDIVARCGAVSKATAILTELEGSLDHTAGGSISRNLSELYQYMRARLVDANFQKSDAALAEVQSLLATMAEGWSGVASKTAAGTAPAATPWMSVPVEEASEELMAHSWNA